MSDAHQNMPSRALQISSALFEIEMGEPSKHSRIVLKAVAALFAILLIWAMVAKLDIVAVATGRLVPQTYVKIVQPAEAGVIREILVQEGQVVEQGQVLARLDPTINSADARATERELAMQRLQMRRIEAELADQPFTRQISDEPVAFAQVHAQYMSHRQAFLDSISHENALRLRSTEELKGAQEMLKKLETTLPSYQKTAQAYETLSQRNLVGSIQAEEKKREALEKAQDLEAQRAAVAALQAAVSQIDRRIAQIRSTHASELNQERLQAVAVTTRLEQQSDKLSYQQGLLELRAPQEGIVKELATTTLGAVVQPGTVLMSLVPQSEPLIAEVLVENKDVGFVAPGQEVRVKIAAYQFQKYGMVEGKVKTISADSSRAAESREGPSDQANPSFKALVDLQGQELKVGKVAYQLSAGMQVTAEIVQGERTVMEYLLSPVQRVLGETGMER
jgi:HlyD family secretion protein